MNKNSPMAVYKSMNIGHVVAMIRTVSPSLEHTGAALEVTSKVVFDIIKMHEQSLTVNDLLHILDEAIGSNQLTNFKDWRANILLKRAFCNFYDKMDKRGKSTEDFDTLTETDRAALWPTFMMALLGIRQAMTI